MSPRGEQFVFGYGSLAAFDGGRPARLQGHRRVWGVAMDNRVKIAGYKCYRRGEDGGRPAVYVAFLDIVPEAGASTDGVLLAVDGAALRDLDDRERNYARIDVTEHVRAAPGTVWTYAGTSAGRARLRAGLRDATAVVQRGYIDAVRAGFAARGIADTIDPGADLPVVDLVRDDLPAA